MEIKQAEFITSAVKNEGLPAHEEVEFMFCGRSNVGKSSFINMLTNRKKLAKTSSNPGKTQTLNVYHINQQFYFIDVPGYGFAKVSKSIKATFGKMIEEYVTERKNLKLVFLLVDFRHKPTEDDVLMYQFLKYYEKRVCVIATKADKVKNRERAKNKKVILETLQLDSLDSFIVTSSETREGIGLVLTKLDEILAMNQYFFLDFRIQLSGDNMQLNIEKHNFCKLEGIANIKNHLEKLSNVKIEESKAAGDVEINISYNDFEGMECFKALSFSFDLDLAELKILELNIGMVNVYVVEGQGLDISYELVVNYLTKEPEQAVEIKVIEEPEIVQKFEKPKELESSQEKIPEDKLEQFKEEMKEYYEDKLASNLQRNDQVIVTKTHETVESFLNFFEGKQGFYKLKCLYVEHEQELEAIAKEYNVKLDILLAGYDRQTHKVIFSIG